MGSEPENEFLQHEIVKAYKRNTFIGKALQGMESTERISLFGDDSKSQDVALVGADTPIISFALLKVKLL